MHPSGRFAVASNRVVDGEGSVTCFELDAATGVPTLLSVVGTGGEAPRDVEFVAGGALLVVVAGRIIAARNARSVQHQTSDQ